MIDLLAVVGAVESNRRLDGAADNLHALAGALSPAAQAILDGGKWTGHPLHPPMTDLPIGCWTSSMMLDFMGGTPSRAASQRLIGWGVLLAVPTLATGLNALGGVEDVSSQRVGVVHAVGNVAATGAYAVSWCRRRSGDHRGGLLWGLIGAALATGAGYLGGHLAFGEADSGSEDAGADAPGT